MPASNWSNHLKEPPHFVAWYGSYHGTLPVSDTAQTRVIDCGLLTRTGHRYAVRLTPAETYSESPVEVLLPDGTVRYEEAVSWDAHFCETATAFTWGAGTPRFRVTLSCVNGNDLGSIIDHVLQGLGHALAELLQPSGNGDPGSETNHS